jgi:hypothetical protein
MKEHYEILIDASGSMGYMKGDDDEDKYLLPDKSTRTDLVKKILINTLIPKLAFVNNLNILTFRRELTLNDKNEFIADVSKPFLKYIYNDTFDENKIKTVISEIENPEKGGTPIFGVVSSIIKKNKALDIKLIIISDGDANDEKEFDVALLKKINSLNVKCKIYFIGIDQDEEAQKKSKNLADKTNGFYINLEAINYEETIFDNMLFEFNTTITSNALKEQFKIDPLVSETISKIIEEKNEPKTVEEEEELNIAKTVQEEAKPIDLEKQVEENTKSLQLITSQLDSIVKQISFIGKEKSNDKDEFEANEDEERNRVIGYQCEKHINSVFLKNNWEKVDWLNENAEQSKPYDFEVTVKGINYYIECKGSTSNSKEFFLTKNEWLFYLTNRKNYRLYFVSEINSQYPTIHRIEDLLKDMEEGKLIPCSSVNRKLKADRILFQIIN